MKIRTMEDRSPALLDSEDFDRIEFVFVAETQTLTHLNPSRSLRPSAYPIGLAGRRQSRRSL
jgi:hypothetical protein